MEILVWQRRASSSGGQRPARSKSKARSLVPTQRSCHFRGFDARETAAILSRRIKMEMEKRSLGN
eukprot:5573282-Pleurochrysis_carterae.AAC.2